MNDQSSKDILTRLLRENDPLATDPHLSSTEKATIRCKILAALPDSSSDGRWSWSPAPSVAALLAIALAAAWWPRPTDRAEQMSLTGSPLTEPVSSVTSVPEAERREIQFETPGGTLVVWVLDPNFPS